MKALFLATALLLAPLAPMAQAGTLSDLIMDGGVLADLPPGESLTYRLDRHLPAPPAEQAQAERSGEIRPLQPIANAEVKITAKTGEKGLDLVLSLTEGEGDARKSQDKATFSAKGANPMLLFFLENVVRSVAAQTGGSPYYIRNRIRDAIVTLDVSGKETATIALTPFRNDRNAARLGDFVNLTIAITFDPARPGHLINLKADSPNLPDGYREEMTLLEKG